MVNRATGASIGEGVTLDDGSVAILFAVGVSDAFAEFDASGAAGGKISNDLPSLPLPPGGETHAGELVVGVRLSLSLPLPPLPLPPLPLPPLSFCFWRLLETCLQVYEPCSATPQ